MKTVLITGASRGIGRAVAIELAGLGYNIVLNYKERDDAADEVAQILQNLGARYLKIKCDVRKYEEVAKMHAKIRSVFGSVDVLINNAGVALGGLVQFVSESDYDYIMDTNLKGTFNVCKACIPDMIANQWGRIINISSIWGLVGGANESVYSASKAGIIGLTKALSHELAPSNITVNCIAPGAILTDMLRQLPISVLEGLKNEIPAGRLGDGKDVAAMVAFLISESSDYTTGQTINISGGFTIT